ncbi:MAG: glycosyltransferase family 4 protein [Muribaculaceae bacterium]|nr:glycosyltransferase family 4 protein [Muribaculaceae bacterium]
MKILFILQYIPYPLDSGGNQAMFNMIDKIREHHEVSLLIYIRTKADEVNISMLRNIWDNVTFYTHKDKEIIGPTSCTYKLLKYIQQSFTRKVNRRYRKWELQQGSRNFDDIFVRNNSCLFNNFIEFSKEYGEYVYQISRKGFDIIQVEFFESLPLIYLLPENTTNVFVHHEIRFVRTENILKVLHENTPNDILQRDMLKDLEIRALSRYDKIIVLTETDRQILLNENPNLDIYVSPAVVKFTNDKYLKFGNPSNELVFIGGGWHFPNVDGLLWFCRDVIPVLSSKIDNIKLNIVGKWPDMHKEHVKKIFPQANFVGFVDDLNAYSNGKISIVPIRIGSGMRMKILDSIVSCSPIVTTTKGMEGLPLNNGEDCYITDVAEDFADAIMTLIKNPELQNRFVENAQNKLNIMLNFQELQQKRIDFYSKIK